MVRAASRTRICTSKQFSAALLERTSEQLWSCSDAGSFLCWPFRRKDCVERIASTGLRREIRPDDGQTLVLSCCVFGCVFGCASQLLKDNAGVLDPLLHQYKVDV